MGKFYSTPLCCYILGFLVPYALTFVPFSESVGNYHPTTHILILGSSGAFMLGLLFVAIGFPDRRVPQDIGTEIVAAEEPFVISALYAWYIAAFLCLTVEFIAIGGFPLLMADVETVRFNLKVNGYVHLIAISLGTVSCMMLYFAHYCPPGRRRAYRWLGWVGVIYLLFTGGRSDAGIAVAMALLAVAFRSKTGLRPSYVVASGFLAALFVGVSIYRGVTHDPQFFLLSMTEMQTKPTFLLLALLPLYMTITYNFTILDRLVRVGAAGISHGAYTFYGFLSITPFKPMDYGEFKNNLLGVNFYAELTSTYISNFYLDFGMWGAIVGAFILGAIIQSVYRVAKQDGRYILVYGLVYLQYAIFFYMYVYVILYYIAAPFVIYFFCRYGLTRIRIAETNATQNGMVAIST